MESTARSVTLLLVEDNLADIRLTQEALKSIRLKVRLEVVRDGEEALKYLRRLPPYEHTDLPDLVLLDLNLPGKDGREVLAELKEDEELRRIPVVILSSSQAEEDIARTYELHANCYITKPADFHAYQDVMKAIEDFWFTIVKLPPDPE